MLRVQKHGGAQRHQQDAKRQIKLKGQLVQVAREVSDQLDHAGHAENNANDDADQRQRKIRHEGHP